MIVSVSPAETDSFLARAQAAGVTAARIGLTGGARLRIAIDGRAAIDCGVSEAESNWATGFSKWLETHG
ncbi:hypothetical protein D3C83_246620 [compost metagenome]